MIDLKCLKQKMRDVEEKNVGHRVEGVVNWKVDKKRQVKKAHSADLTGHLSCLLNRAIYMMNRRIHSNAQHSLLSDL